MYRNFVDVLSGNNVKDVEKEAGSQKSRPTTFTGMTCSTATLGSPPKLSNCKFGWRDISYSVDTKKGKKEILQNISGCVEKGPFPTLYPSPIPRSVCSPNFQGVCSR